MKLKQHQIYLQELLDTENERLNKLHEIVAAAVEEHSLLTESLSKKDDDEDMSLGDRIATRVARFVGSWAFVISFCVVFFTWILINGLEVFYPIHFDRYPFDNMKLTLSCIASIQGPLIMMSQNRSAKKEKKRKENQYLINLKAEIEVRNLHSKMDLLMKDQMKNLLEVQKIQLDLIEKLYIKIDKLKEKNTDKSSINKDDEDYHSAA
jgi:uncharacterized membrane protein